MRGGERSVCGIGCVLRGEMPVVGSKFEDKGAGAGVTCMSTELSAKCRRQLQIVLANRWVWLPTFGRW